jgi:Asp-tRNA(Asn)/Glu-tRNA(Gln) amidotransferase A subunit family amidase
MNAMAAPPLQSATRQNVPDSWGAFVQRFDDQRGVRSGVLDGVTLAVKDMIDVAGATVSFGLGAAAAVGPAAEDAPVVARLVDAGARIVGITAMTALAYEPSGTNDVQGRPKNPGNAQRICGGSSSGSAVAVAAGLAALAIGSDTGGSLRIPAHCCGVFAWKPTHGLVPTVGTMPLAPSLDTIGFLAADLETLGIVAELFGAPAQTQINRVRHLQDLSDAAAPDIQAAMSTVVSVIALHAICDSADGQPLLNACDPQVMVLMQGEAARAHRTPIETGTLDPTLSKRLAKGLTVTESDLAAARAGLRATGAALTEGVLAGADALLLPVMPITTPLVAECEPASPDFSARTLYALSAYTRFVNGLGLPAVAFPIGFDEAGMPIGAQLVGPRGSDLALIRFAQILHRQLHPDGLPRPPSPPVRDGA